ncbi:MAG: 16S rRNA (guanine(527)-N(7))-methyltransferase RsmG, partial [Bacteroidota bacterium]
HIPHCLALALRRFPPRAIVCDWGTGGGLPLIPLAVLFPETDFIGVDAVEKKVQAVRTFARRLGLNNASAVHARAEQTLIEHHYSVSRATAPLSVLWSWHLQEARPCDASPARGMWQPGLICLKGGDLEQEIAELKSEYGNLKVERIDIADRFSDPYFQHKEIVAVHTRSSHE